MREVTAGKLVDIQRKFEEICASGATSSKVALFARVMGVRCYELYFSPASSVIGHYLIKDYHGVPADPPPKEATYLLVGLPGIENTLLRKSWRPYRKR